MPSFYHLLTIIRMLEYHITRELGGEVTFVDNKEENGVILRWKRHDRDTKKTRRFNHKISYDDIEDIREPAKVAYDIIDQHKKDVQND